jgi:hypothetical protein
LHGAEEVAGVLRFAQDPTLKGITKKSATIVAD